MPRSSIEKSKPLNARRSSDEEEAHLFEAPPPYELHATGDVLGSTAAVTDDGRINVSLTSKSPAKLAELLHLSRAPASAVHETVVKNGSWKCPRLNIVIHVVGSRGDVQPFIAYGTGLQRAGHRVRLATHNTFADFVRKSGLEFYPIGGDPADLMSYMVRNPGLIPTMESMRRGDVGQKRKMIKEMIDGCWESCFYPDPLTHEPFVANAIVANPPSFAHVHCAEALGIPVHIMFTMPWSATKAFPHPLANLNSDNMKPTAANWLSYGVVDIMTWQGLGDLINHWRRKRLGLDVLQGSMGPGLTGYLKIPHTYCWSPALMEKPTDWGPEIDVCGFFLRDEPKYDCPSDLQSFLRAGPTPIYVGFGSIVIDDPKRLTDIILQAARACGTRVIISKGWSKLGGDDPNTDQVFYLGDCPHEWLFKQVSVVVHHGGAGTTACGLVNARPTIIIPFFGDQPFWGQVVAAAGAGSLPIPHKELTTEALVEALHQCFSNEVQIAAEEIATKMRRENGVAQAVESFHRNLPIPSMVCDVLPQYAATWKWKKKGNSIKLCDLAASALIAEGKLKSTDLKPLVYRSYNTDVDRWDPLTGGASSVIGSLTDMTVALGQTFIDPYKAYKQHRLETTDQQQGSVGSAIGSAAMASGKGLGRLYGAMAKGALLDLPLALSEGLRNAPRLYGAEADDYGRAKDWKSGCVVGGKSLGLGLYNGVAGLITEPSKGLKEEGAVGFAKGLGKGTVGLLTKTSTASVGIFAYPAQGIYKSIVTRSNPRLLQEKVATRNGALPYVDDGFRRHILQEFRQIST